MLELDLGESVHRTDVTLPEGVTCSALALGDEANLTVASVQAPRGLDEEELEAAEAAEAAEFEGEVKAEADDAESGSTESSDDASGDSTE